MRRVAWFQCLCCQLTLTWGHWIFSHLLNPDWSIQISRALTFLLKIVCSSLKYASLANLDEDDETSDSDFYSPPGAEVLVSHPIPQPGLSGVAWAQTIFQFQSLLSIPLAKAHLRHRCRKLAWKRSQSPVATGLTSRWTYTTRCCWRDPPHLMT